jgi:DNA (cytosine-5)-methyltransferase 1
MLTIGTDCSGIEAPIAALQQLKIPHRHLWSCEIDKFARRSIEANYNPETIYEDITKRDHSKLPDVDIYVCGFPCQPFSLAGKLRGLNDKRSNVMFECIKVIKTKKPKIFILENVKNFAGFDKGRPYKHLMRKLHQLRKYNIHSQNMNTRDYGIPHNRDRLYIVGICRDVQICEFQMPPSKCMKPLDKFLESTKIHAEIPLTQKDIARLEKHQNRSLSSLRGNYVAARDVFMFCMNGVVPTIKTKSDHYLVKYQRFLNPREYLNLQGFPKSFKIVVSKTQIVKQAGNSMSVCVLIAIFKGLQTCTNVF